MRRFQPASRLHGRVPAAATARPATTARRRTGIDPHASFPRMIPPLSLAAAQTIPVRGDVDANLAQHIRLARLAAHEGARMVVYPELSLTGYELDLAGDLAFSAADPRLAPLADAAASASQILIVGAPVRIGARLHIGAFI